VKEWNDEIVFVRRVISGAADRSYGIQVARLAGLPLSVVAIDFDKLKQVNDSLGHRVGDEALKILAREISYGVRPSDRGPAP